MRSIQAAVILSFLAVSSLAAPMSRVVKIVDSRTLIVETAGATTTVRLANVDIPAEAERDAVAFLERELLNRWTLVEPAAGGGSTVYRSPDTMLVNRAVVQNWLYGPTRHAGIELGVIAPRLRQEKTASLSMAKGVRRVPPRPRTRPRIVD